MDKIFRHSGMSGQATVRTGARRPAAGQARSVELKKEE
jgi:hypothetical protein